MENSQNIVLSTVAPKKDGRWRVGRSERLWVITRRWSKDKSHIESCGAIESIERSVYRMEGSNGEWVRYCNRYHLLHTAQEFSDLLASAGARAGKFYFFNNEAGAWGNAETDTQAAPFIFADEPGSFA